MDYFNSLNANGLDPDIPTLFELLSSHQLQDLIPPSLRYILTFYAQRHPQYLLKLANRFDEIYAVLMGTVEYYHLKNWNSSFTEKFYGIKRTRLLTTPALNTRDKVPSMFESQRRLSKKQIWLCLFFTIGMPYLKEKLDARYEILKGRYAFRSMEQDGIIAYEEGSVSDKMKFELDRFILKVYPKLNSAQNLLCLAFYLGFLFQKTTSTSPVDAIVGFKYSRLNQHDYKLNEPTEEDERSLFDKITSLSGVKNMALSSLSYTLPTSMFLLKFLEWWYASDFANSLASAPRFNVNEDGNYPVPKHATIKAPSVTGLCPICRTTITNPTVIESGVVFCYPCIYRYLENKDPEKVKGVGRCPVTGQRLLGVRYSDDKEDWEIDGLRRLMI